MAEGGATVMLETADPDHAAPGTRAEVTNLDLPQLFLLTIIGLITVWAIRRKFWVQTKLQRLGYSVPPTRFISGNMHELRNDHLETQIRWMKEYGGKSGKMKNIMGFYRGPSPILMVTNTDVLKEVLVKQWETFIDRVLFDNIDRLPQLVNLKGSRWKRVRSVLTPTFSAAKLKRFNASMNRCIHVLLEIVGKKAKANEPCNIYSMFQALTLDVIGECALAMTVDCQRNPEDTLLLSVRRLFGIRNTGIKLLFAHFPEITWIANMLKVDRPDSKLLKSEGGLIVDWVKKVIDQRQENAKQNKNAPMDALQLMIDAAKDENNETGLIDDKIGLMDGEYTGRRKYLTKEEITANSFVFVAAGYETTATALSFTAYLLAVHPEIQEKVVTEIEENVKENEHPTYDSVQKLQYLDQVFNESTRVYPPIPTFFGRVAKEDCEVLGLKIPKGCGVQVPVWAIHHDPDLWPEPDKFDPDRWSPENKTNIGPMTHMPFGAGPRKCIGMRFAMMEAKLALIQLVRKFQLQICDETEVPLEVTTRGLSLLPESGHIYIQAVPRN